MPFTPQQERFIAEYVATSNATRSAIAAGYSERSAHAQGSALLKRPDIAEEIERKKNEITKKVLDRYEVSREKIVRKLATLGFSNMGDYTAIDGDDVVLDMSTVDRDQMGAIKEITSEVYVEGRGDEARSVKRTNFKLYDARAALMDLAKLEGHIIDRQQLSGPGGGPIPIAGAHVVDLKQVDPETRERMREAVQRSAEQRDD